jgi:hypothetical protein
MTRGNLLILVFLTFISAWLTEALVDLINVVSPALDIVLGTLFFLLFFIFFDRFLWTWLGLGKQAKMHGDWLGRLNTSRTENTEVETIRVKIIQHWLTSRVDFVAPYSRSSSLAAVFYRDKQGNSYLAYIYRSEPYEGQENVVPAHIGLAILRLIEPQKLSGYFHHLEAEEGSVKFTHGQMVLTRP